MNKNNKIITVWGGISILAGIMIGSGIFFLGSQILTRAGNSLWLSLAAWIVGGIITLFAGLSYAELGSLFPENGGYYVYLKEAYGKKMAFLSGFMNMVLSTTGSISLLAILFGQVISNIFVEAVPYINLIAISAIIILTFVNYIGLKLGEIVQMVFMVAKLIPIIMIIIMGILVGREPIVSTSTLGDMTFFEGVIAFAFAIVGTLWAYDGWTNLNAIAGHMKDAKKDLPKALTVAIAGVIIIYALFIFSLYRLVSYQSLFDAYNGWFIFDAAYALFGQAGQTIIMTTVAVSVFGALNGTVMVTPHVYQKMAQDGLFFKIFAKEDKKFHTPVYSLLLSAVIAIILILLNFDIESLLTFVIFAGLIFNTLILISLFLFRKRLPVKDHPRYQVWGYPVIPIIAVAGMLLLLTATLIQSFIPSIIGLSVLVVGYIVIYFTQKK